MSKFWEMYNRRFEMVTRQNCGWCDARFITIQEIRKHVYLNHPFNCSDCLKNFPKFVDFTNHAKTCKFAEEFLRVNSALLKYLYSNEMK
jgi:hypothetical protein